MMNVEKLPIGSVVILEGATKKIMVIGYNITQKSIHYDYLGCLYPEGIRESNIRLLFNHKQILTVFAEGYIEGVTKNELEEKIKDNSNASISTTKAIEVLELDDNSDMFDLSNFKI